jgi:hypothetical protein
MSTTGLPSNFHSPPTAIFQHGAICCQRARDIYPLLRYGEFFEIPINELLPSKLTGIGT